MALTGPAELLDAVPAAATYIIRQSVELVLQALIESLGVIAPGRPDDRSTTRTTERKGRRPGGCRQGWRREARRPKRRRAASILNRRLDRATFAVVMEAYAHAVSTRKVNDCRCPSASSRGSPSRTSPASCADLDADLEAFRTHPPPGTWAPLHVAVAAHVKGGWRAGGVSGGGGGAPGELPSGRREVLGSWRADELSRQA